MADRQRASILDHLRELVAAETLAGRSDRELLENFVRSGDEAAFAALVRRHGPMVLGVCRRVLRHAHDAEDACQAAFLVLARKARSIRKRASLGSWLYGVAYRSAARLKRDMARRRAYEARAEAPQGADGAEVIRREVRTVLDEELRRLPERFQAPLLMCYLEGRSREEAARELGWSAGTLRGRLERGRTLLRSRLARRGLLPSAALLATELGEEAASAAFPALLVARAAKPAALLAAGRAAPAGLISTRVLALMKGVLRTMLVTRLQTVTAAAIILAVVGVGVGIMSVGGLTAQPPELSDAPRGPAAAGGVGQRDERANGPGAAGQLGKRDDGQDLTRAQGQSRLNLKRIALAMHNYLDVYKRLPAPAIYAGDFHDGQLEPSPTADELGERPGGASTAAPGTPGGPLVLGEGPGGASAAAPRAPGRSPVRARKRGAALLSWRVALLPYLDEMKLFKQFKLDEAWDSPHNKKLLNKMPRVYAPPGVTTREPYTTFYQVFVGPHAAFEKHRAMRVPAAFPDGTSNVLLVVEAGAAVPWTKPEDLHFAPDEAIPGVGGLYRGLFNAAFVDGSVHALSTMMDSETLRRAIMRDDGNVVDLDRWKLPVSQREGALKRENLGLQEALDVERRQLQDLRQQKKELQHSDDAEAERLRKDNARLQELLRQTREEAERLRAEIRGLQQRPAKRPAGGP